MTENLDTITLSTELTVAWLSNPHTRVTPKDVTAFLSSMHQALGTLPNSEDPSVSEPGPAEHVPAVSVRRSLASPDHILSMIDGKPYKALKRHLGRHGLTPAQYRDRYGLKPDYPMVAPSYSEVRRAAAKGLELGGKPKPKEATAAAKPTKSTRAATKPPARKRLGIAGPKASDKSAPTA